MGFIEPQARYFDRARLSEGAAAQIRDELAWARAYARDSRGTAQPITLCATDTHPGNFLIEHAADAPPHAVFVDLEKALYGSPAIDVAHAITGPGTEPLLERELPLEQVAAAIDRAQWIALDQEDRRARRHVVPDARADRIGRDDGGDLGRGRIVSIVEGFDHEQPLAFEGLVLAGIDPILRAHLVELELLGALVARHLGAGGVERVGR